MRCTYGAVAGVAGSHLKEAIYEAGQDESLLEELFCECLKNVLMA